MPRFFSDNIGISEISLSAEDTKHLSVLRYKIGDIITVCDKQGMDYITVIEELSIIARLRIIEKFVSKSEPNVKITLYQALPKADKFDMIVQKAVELGVHAIVPVMTERCVSRPDEKSMSKKIQRYNKIALEAAKQSGRGIIPLVQSLISFNEAVKEMQSSSLPIIFYENSDTSLKTIMSPTQSVSLLIGSEGGLTESEIVAAQNSGINILSLGPRILRCETAPICAISAILYATDNL